MSRVAVVTPCHNGGRYLNETVCSVQCQTLDDWRYFLVDDASTDETLAIMETAERRDARITVIHLPVNQGVAAARNTGAALTDADYVLFLDADDVLEPGMLERTALQLDRRGDATIAYTRHSYIGADGADLGPDPGKWPWARCVATRFWVRMLADTDPTTPFESIFLVAVILPSKALIRRSALVAAGGWDASFGQGCEDTDLFLRLALLGPVLQVPEVLVGYRRHPAQWTKTARFEAQYQKLTTKWLELDFPRSDQREVVEAAMWFRNHRFYPYRKLLASWDALGRGALRSTARSLLGAVSDYSFRRPPTALYGWSQSTESCATGLKGS